MRRTGLAFIVIGLVVPRVIDWYETVNRLDIRRDIGVLPWMILATVGAVLLLASLFSGEGTAGED